MEGVRWELDIQHHVYQAYKKEKVVKVIRMWTHYD